MKTLREAAEMALKSLEDAIKVWTEEMEFRSCIDASDAWLESYAVLREALSEPEQEPVAWMVYTQDGTSAFVTDNPKDFTDTHRALPLYTSPPQRKPLTDESIGEVAIQDTQYHGYAMAIKPHIQGALHEGTKLYTSPPQRKPLTEEEMRALWESHGYKSALCMRFARAIERAHGIGEKR